MNLKSPEIGVDIIFFDAEDYGTPEFVTDYVPNSWCLGSQFWAKNPHVPNYKADFGILLDMVGAKNATFYKEYTSMRYAARYVDLVWNTARNLGYGKYFIQADGNAITDDHQYVISGRGIPCLDIIYTNPEAQTGFGSHWHTLNDTIDEFSAFDDWMDKYALLIDLGNSLPVLEEKYKTESNLIEGCQSRVWLQADYVDGKIFFKGDSDAVIVKGIVSLLINVLSEHTPQEILDADLYFIEKIGLKEHLSPTRSNGLVAMVKQMHLYAVAFRAKEKEAN